MPAYNQGSRGKGWKRRLSAAALICLLAAVRGSAAEAMPIPPDVQITLLLKVLTYDRLFSTKAKSGVSIGVIYVPSDPESVRVKDEVLRTLARVADRTIKNVPIKYVALEFKDVPTLEKAVRANRVNVFYVAPGNAAGLAALVKMSQTYAITSATGVPEFVDRGIAIGIGMKADNKPDILINLVSSRKEGSDFDASLLRIARVVK
jgi:hypothetical protein